MSSIDTSHFNEFFNLEMKLDDDFLPTSSADPTPVLTNLLKNHVIVLGAVVATCFVISGASTSNRQPTMTLSKVQQIAGTPVIKSPTDANERRSHYTTGVPTEYTSTTINLISTEGSWTEYHAKLAVVKHPSTAYDNREDRPVGYDTFVEERPIMLSRLLHERKIGEVIGLSISIVVAFVLTMIAATSILPWAAIAPGALMCVLVASFVCLRWILRGDHARDRAGRL